MGCVWVRSRDGVGWVTCLDEGLARGALSLHKDALFGGFRVGHAC